MKNFVICICFCFFYLCCFNNCLAADDLGFGAYQSDLNKAADAHATKIYDAWSENMAYRINNGMTEGIVVDGASNTKDYLSDGLGNVLIKDGANIGTIINKTEIKNSTVIIKDSGNGSRF